MEMNTPGAIRAGRRGLGITQTAIHPGALDVILPDISDELVRSGFDSMARRVRFDAGEEAWVGG